MYENGNNELLVVVISNVIEFVDEEGKFPIEKVHEQILSSFVDNNNINTPQRCNLK